MLRNEMRAVCWRKFGPYGGPEGKERSQYFNEITGYVHNLDAKVVITGGSLGIQFLRIFPLLYCTEIPPKIDFPLHLLIHIVNLTGLSFMY
jgi:hypothetical protein